MLRRSRHAKFQPQLGRHLWWHQAILGDRDRAIPCLRRQSRGKSKTIPGTPGNRNCAGLRGVRYRYYVSHALLQSREKDAGRVTRVPAIQLEKLVVEAVRAKAWPGTEPKGGLSDREVIDRYVMSIIVRPDSIDIELMNPTAASSPATDASVAVGAAASSARTTVISLPWSAPAFPSVRA
jgi:hypothetical protein